MEVESGSDGESVSSANQPNGRASSEKTSREPSTAVKDATASNWRYGEWLMGKSLGELERMPAANALYMKVIEGNIRQIGERMKCMKLGERNVEVTKYPTEEDARLLHNVMRDYNSNYDDAIRGKKDQSKMKRIDRMLRCPKHTQITD